MTPSSAQVGGASAKRAHDSIECVVRVPAHRVVTEPFKTGHAVCRSSTNRPKAARLPVPMRSPRKRHADRDLVRHVQVDGRSMRVVECRQQTFTVCANPYLDEPTSPATQSMLAMPVRPAPADKSTPTARMNRP